MADEITPAVLSPERRPHPEATPPASSPSDTTALYRRRSSLKMAAEVPPGAELAMDSAPGRAATASADSSEDIDVAVVMRPGGAAGTPATAELDEMPSRLPSVNLEIVDPGVPPAPLVARHSRARTAASAVVVVLLIAAGWLLRSLF